MKELNSVERYEIARAIVSENFSSQQQLDLIKDGAYASLYRVRGENRVIKIAAEHRIDLEVLFYHTLAKHELPAIDHQRLSHCALSLEDLVTSKKWRLATQEDVHNRSIGVACAKWYQALHGAGRVEYRENPAVNALHWEFGDLNEEALHHAGHVHSLPSFEAWNQACKMSGQIVDYLRPHIDTLTYNDFFYVNLAVSRQNESTITLFDFDHSGKGFAESDYMNVSSGLRGEALASFRSLMPADQGRLIMHEFLSTLHGLVVASKRAQTPTWAQQLVENIKTPEFIATLKKVESLMKLS